MSLSYNCGVSMHGYPYHDILSHVFEVAAMFFQNSSGSASAQFGTSLSCYDEQRNTLFRLQWGYCDKSQQHCSVCHLKIKKQLMQIMDGKQQRSVEETSCVLAPSSSAETKKRLKGSAHMYRGVFYLIRNVMGFFSIEDLIISLSWISKRKNILFIQ